MQLLKSFTILACASQFLGCFGEILGHGFERWVGSNWDDVWMVSFLRKLAHYVYAYVICHMLLHEDMSFLSVWKLPFLQLFALQFH